MHRAGGGLRYDGKIAGLYDLEETLGSGHFAIVKSARHVFTGEKVAVKVIDKSKLDEVSRAHLFQEVRCMKLVQHPNVVRLYEVIDTQTKLYLILELADGGDLYDYIMRHETGLAEDMAREYFRQIVRAISYCHRLHVVHRDLKPENVVFFETLGMVKLTDFGFSNRFNPGQKLETSCGSLAYSAPEILLGDSYDAPAVDVWSLGVILYMLVCGQAPFQEANDSETLTMIMDVKYTIPSHVSEGCKRLIGRMLVREPERRASLAQIAADPWLREDGNAAACEPADFLPLVSREHVSDEDHALIVQKMVNGNIANKEDILEALDRNEYNHITATYFLLAERKLRAHRQEQATNQQKLRNQLPSPSTAKPFVKVDASAVQQADAPSDVDQSLLRPTDATYRARKCSIVQEEEDEDDMATASRDEPLPSHCSLNRRGSRSEGKLNLVLAERLAESERRKEAAPAKVAGIPRVGVCDDTSKPTSVWTPTGKRNLPPSSDKVKPLGPANSKWRMGENKKPPPRTSVLADSATVPGAGAAGAVPRAGAVGAVPTSRYKTMPSPTRAAPGTGALNEIFEEGDPEDGQTWPSGLPARPTPARTPAYEQRRAKFHKARTASCSSSDASDDDSESRKKRAHKLSAEGKPVTARRDSHDDSSDSQDPSGGGGAGGGGGGGGSRNAECANPGTKPPPVADGSRTAGGTGGGSDSRQCSAGRRQRAGRRRAGETRLRESQSLNRITEVQEAEHPAAPPPPGVGPPHVAPPTHKAPKGFGARLLGGWTLGAKKGNGEEQHGHGGNVKVPESEGAPRSKRDSDEKENCKSAKPEKSKPGKKVRLLGRYFQMHKKLCLPLPGIFGRGRLYKAQSCSSILRERVSPPTTAALVPCEDGWRTERVPRKSDVNRNVAVVRSTPRLDCIVPLVANCPGIKICHVHLGDVSKCCHLC